MLPLLALLALQIARAEPLLPVEQYRLPNGLTVVFALDTTTPYLAVETWYPAGTRDDPPAKRGLSHLFEHSFVSRRLYSNPANAPARGRFVNSNAQTRRDYTRYYSEVRAQDLALALALHADRMDTPDSLLTDSVVARNVDVVVNEGRQGRVTSVEDGPGSFFLLGQYAFATGHPYANGSETETTLRAIMGEDLRAWRRAHYGPERAIVLLIGRFDRERARSEIDRMFGAIPPGGGGDPVRARGIALPTPARRDRITGRITQPQLWRRWATPWYGEPDADLLQLAAIVLARPQVGPVAATLLRDGHLASGPSWQTQLSELSGDVHISLTTRDGRGLEAAEAALDAAVERLATVGPSPEDLDWARREWELVLLSQLEPLGFQSSRAEVLGEGLLFSGDAERYRERLARVRGASSAAVAAAVGRWMLGAGYTLELVPRPDVTPPSRRVVDRAATIPLEPVVGARLALAESAPARGPRLIVSERPASPFVRLSLILPAALGERSAATTDLISRVVARQLERSAVGRVERGATADEATVSLTIRPADLDRAVVALGGLASGRIDRSWQTDREVVRTRVTPTDNDLARRLALGGGHGEAVQDSAAATLRLAGHDEASIGRLIRGALAQPGTRLLVSGQLSTARLSAVANRAFESWPGAGSVPHGTSAAASPAAPGVYVRSVPGRTQFRVAAVILLPPGTSPAVEALLESDLQGRMNTRLRVERQWSYGASSGTVGPAGGRATVVWAEVQSDRGGDAVAEMERVLAEYRDDRGARDTTGLAESLRQSIARRAQTLSGLEGLAREALVSDGDPARLVARFDRIGKLGAGDIDAARAAADPSKARYLVTGDAEMISAQLARLSRPRPTVVTP